MLILYYRPSCPYCQAVLREGERLGCVAFELRNISNSEHASALMQRGGKQQVPYLIDEGRGVEMYESEDIVAYLREQYGQR